MSYKNYKNHYTNNEMNNIKLNKEIEIKEKS